MHVRTTAPRATKGRGGGVPAAGGTLSPALGGMAPGGIARRTPSSPVVRRPRPGEGAASSSATYCPGWRPAAGEKVREEAPGSPDPPHHKGAGPGAPTPAPPYPAPVSKMSPYALAGPCPALGSPAGESSQPRFLGPHPSRASERAGVFLPTSGSPPWAGAHGQATCGSTWPSAPDLWSEPGPD